MLYLQNLNSIMIKKLFITLFVSVILVSCVKKRDLSQNTVIAHITVQPDGLHPFNDNSAIRSYIFNYTQKTLIKLDINSLDYIPSLVKNMPDSPLHSRAAINGRLVLSLSPPQPTTVINCSAFALILLTVVSTFLSASSVWA